MQALSLLPLLHTFPKFTELSSVSGNLDPNFTLTSFCRDLSFRLKIDDSDENLHQQKPQEEAKHQQQQEFTFPCAHPPQGSLLAADEIFDNGMIRTISPVSDQSKLFSAADGHGGQGLPLLPPPTKLFVPQKCDDIPWHGDLFRETATLETWQTKCNSTGFSKLYRYRRDVKHRRNSEGTGAFVFLNPPPGPEKVEKQKEVKNDVVKCGKRKTAPSSWAHEKLYLMNRKRSENNKRRSFLPYKKQIFGLFSNMNLHPF
ncbi:hypothetical protein HN51_013587 [Arachis hypogaea]|uniref:Uncharacterized protein n=1 Tax=Arachis hypogaea TaxID=3818 RepID=A0A445DPK1_ARAHY|nr:uncharacterized protein LOC112783002 [Arachis hypogaea]QHO59326.1 uncharacterized protein DS421_3g98250 [Arachis hypogaea]RYR65102.1 hypothetical protein Ahy_A03g011094 [Arachis hypogaea]